jgi:pimeloyl-ACP methyl ester carboxylesterase
MSDPVLSALGEIVPLGVRRRELRRAGRWLRWIEAGEGYPPVLAVAGLGEPGSLAWAGILSAVATQARIVAYDRAGTGASDAITAQTMDDQVEDLAAVIASAGDGGCIIAGHSWGGLLAQVVAWRQPDLVAGLVLVDPADERFSVTLPDEQHKQRRETDQMFLDLHQRGELRDTIRAMSQAFVEQLSSDPRVREQLLAAWEWCYSTDTQVQSVPDERRVMTSSLAQIASERAAAVPLRIPVTIMSATNGMPDELRLRLTGFHADLASAVPRGRHVVLPDTGHAINEEQPEAVADAITLMATSIRRRDGQP